MNRRVSRMNLKLGIFITGVLLTVMICIVTVSKVSASEHGKREKFVKAITIESGDTLWDIASDLCKNNENLNIQNVVIDIKKINGLNNSDIYVGQQLSIPIY